MTANMRRRTDIGITTGWKRRSPGLDRVLTVTAACFILLSIAPVMSIAELLPNWSSCIGEDCAAAGVGGSNDRSQEVPNVSKHGGNGNTCLTAICNDTATMILNNMDRSVDPCDNFYRYVCGGYINSRKIPDGEVEIWLFSNIEANLEKQLRTLVEAEIEPNEPRAYRLVKKYYKSCMNENAIEARGVQPLLASLRRIGGWPIIEGPSWNESNFDWTKAVDALRESDHHVQIFMNIKAAQSRLNYSENVITISPPDRVRSDGSLSKVIDDVTFAAKVNLTLDIAMSLGAQINAGIREEIEEVWKFAFNLEILPRRHLFMQPTLSTLQYYYPSIPWQEYIYKRLPSTVSIPINGRILLDNPFYFDRLEKLLPNTPKRVLANYIALTTILESMQYLNREMLAKANKLSTGVASSRRKMCEQRVFSLSSAIASMYVSRHLDADTKTYITSVMDDVRKGVRELLETASWLDTITQSRVLKKLDAMRGYIAYADQPSNDTLDKIYESLEIDEEHYYENTHKVSLFVEDFSLRTVQQPIEKPGPIMKINEVVLHYRARANTFALTPGLLQNIYFDKDRPRFMNYAYFGADVGHEMFHGFDFGGRLYNERGQKVKWWLPSSEKEFSQRAQCIADQYSNYIDRDVGLHLDGWATLDEHIADIGGFRGAYRAYNNWVAKNGEEPKLPGIDMTPNQLFWINSATAECSVASSYAHLVRFYDPHGPHELRIVGAMSNIPEFAEDFKCPVGSNMNPSKKCGLW